MLELLEDRLAPATFTVNTTSDSASGSGNSGSLRFGISQVNAGLFDTIDFDIGTLGNTATITPLTALPTISKAVTINGFSQNTGTNTFHLIELLGPSLNDFSGLRLGAGSAGSVIEGMTIGNFGVAGIEIDGAGDGTLLGDKIEGNFIGTDLSGATAVPNVDGIALFDASGNTIGGATVTGGATVGNVISGNNQGVVIFGDGGGINQLANNNLIEGNFIGTDVTGTQPLGNTNGGVLIQGGDYNPFDPTLPTHGTADGNVIGGADNLAFGGTLQLGGQAGNVISGNGLGGVIIFRATNGSTVSGNEVQGNYIGTNAAGTGALGNTGDGVRIDAAGKAGVGNGNTIGGTTNGEGNVISANTGRGIVITGDSSTVVTTGGTALPNTISVASTAGFLASGEIWVQTDNGVVPYSYSNITLTSFTGVTGPSGNSTILNGTVISKNAPANNDVVQGNFIGTDANNSVTTLGNGLEGIYITNGANANTIGGTGTGAGNTIAFNNRAGVLVGIDTTNPVFAQSTTTSMPGTLGTAAPNTGTISVVSTAGFAPSGTLAIPIADTQTTANTSSVSTTVTGLNTSGLFVGMAVTGPDIAPNTTIASIVNPTTITLSQNAAITGTSTSVTFTGTTVVTYSAIQGNTFTGVTGGTGTFIGPVGPNLGATVSQVGAAQIVTQTGTISIGTPSTISGLNTSQLAVGMEVAGLGIQSFNPPTLISAIGANGTITLSQPATVFGTSVFTFNSPLGNNDVSGGAGNLIEDNVITHTGGILLNSAGNSSETTGVQAAPVITNVTPAVVLGVSATTSQVTFTLANQTPGDLYRVEFFSNDPNNPEGRKFLGFLSEQSTPLNPNPFTDTFTTPSGVTDPQFITATATDTNTNNTSQFSNPAPEFADNFLSSTPAATTVAAASTGQNLALMGDITVASTAGFQSSGKIAVLFNTDSTGAGANVNGFRIVTYTTTDATHFKGITSVTGGFGTLSTGQTVVQCTTASALTIPSGSYTLTVASTAGFPTSGQLAVTDSGGVELLNYNGTTTTTFKNVTGGSPGATISAGALVLGNLNPNWTVPANVFSLPGVVIPTGNPQTLAASNPTTNPYPGQVQGLMFNPGAVIQNQIGIMNEDVIGLTLGDVAISADINAHLPAGANPVPANSPGVLNTVGIAARLQPVSGVDANNHSISGDRYLLLLENEVNTLTDFTVVSILRISNLGFGGPDGFAQANNFGWTQITQSTVTVPFQGHVEFDVVNTPSGGVDLTALFNGVVVAHAVDTTGAFGPVNGHLNVTRGPITPAGGVGFFGDGSSLLIGNFAVRKLVATTDSPPFTAAFNNSTNNNSPTELGSSFLSALQNGGFKLQGDRAVSVTSPNYQFAAAQLYGLTNLINPTLQADVDASNPSGTALAAGLFARAQGVPGNAYAAVLTNWGFAEIVLFHADPNPVNDTFTVLKSVTVGVNKGTLQFSLSGNTLTLSLNGSAVVQVTDSTIGAISGQQGIFAWGSGAIIDNFSVSGS
jgi:hypothetical protein